VNIPKKEKSPILIIGENAVKIKAIFLFLPDYLHFIFYLCKQDKQPAEYRLRKYKKPSANPSMPPGRQQP